jgi:hypothetical protein
MGLSQALPEGGPIGGQLQGGLFKAALAFVLQDREFLIRGAKEYGHGVGKGQPPKAVPEVGAALDCLDAPIGLDPCAPGQVFCFHGLLHVSCCV